MSAELDTAKEVIAHPASWFAAATATVGWLGNKLWRAHRHEMANIQQTEASATAAIWKEMDRHRDTQAKIFDQLRDHETKDMERFERQENSSRDRHDEMMALVGDLRADIAGMKK